jgi:maltokinase
VVGDSESRAALPMVCDEAGRWRRAQPGDGAAEALLALLAEGAAAPRRGGFGLQSWLPRLAVGERAVGVDQTNESVIVGDAAVVKWATHMQHGPHPAPHRIDVLREAGFTGMPAPWGLVTWHPPDGPETLVANVDEYLPGAVDGWTWAVDELTAAAKAYPAPATLDTIGRLGPLIADMHHGLRATAGTASAADAARWRASALDTLEVVCALDDSPCVSLTRARRADIAAILDGLGALAGTAVLDGHGDLHVGQILRSGTRLLVTDFDGNPVLPAAQRALPIPAALDVAGMTQSLCHAAIVAAKYAELAPEALAAVDAAARATFLSGYRQALAATDSAQLYDPGPLMAFRMQQVLREIIYAARHLPRWRYVPDAALPALLDEGSTT